ncbi:hypothetical protein [Altibacter sp. HG106]|uniref:hypothetical protein n=1 Tax=Altibacter sp. HG106 TaxID=3023937 RepID=UPI00235089A3|nr:hypothetical protein [Altibacter sp. HG106]MDC7995508.1 hypothetical protein [Altibacter sp. HG106]
MRTILNEDIVIVLTDRGYVASIEEVNLLFWNLPSIDILLDEVKKKFPLKHIHILIDDKIFFEKVDQVVEEYLSSIHLTTISYCLLNVNTKTRTGVLQVKKDIPNTMSVELNVSISPLLAYKIKTKDKKELNPNDNYLGTIFTSSLNSPDPKENPFRLVEFVPDSNSNIPRNFRLELVYETSSEKVDDNGKQKFKFRKRSTDYFKRFEFFSVSKKMENCRSSIKIVPALSKIEDAIS